MPSSVRTDPPASLNAQAPRATAAKPAVRRTQAERSDETRRLIVDAAVEQLRLKGYAGFRITEVAQAAQVSRGAQSHHFPTKDSLIIAAIEQVFSHSRERSLARVAALRPAHDVVDALLQDAEEFFLGPYFPVALDMLNLGDRGPQFREQIQQMSREHRMPVERAWGHALAERGLTPDQAQDLLWLANSVVRGLAVRRLMQDDASRTRRVIDLMRTIASGLLAAPRTGA
jgi:AcrR family transcriptional regulator